MSDKPAARTVFSGGLQVPAGRQAGSPHLKRDAPTHSVFCRTPHGRSDFTCKYVKVQFGMLVRESNAAPPENRERLRQLFRYNPSTRSGAQSGMSPSFMQQAIQRAVENVRSGRGGPFAAIVVKDGHVIATGANAVTSTNDPTAHAEVTAIREACRALGTFQLGGCEIYTSCEPCPMCLGAIYWARPERVYFAATARDAADAGFDDSFIYEELRRPHLERKIPLEGVMREAGLEPFREWMRKDDRIGY